MTAPDEKGKAGAAIGFWWLNVLSDNAPPVFEVTPVAVHGVIPFIAGAPAVAPLARIAASFNLVHYGLEFGFRGHINNRQPLDCRSK
jgi:hypothetical protein